MEAHPHDLVAKVPDRLPGPVIRELSQLRPGRALAAVAEEWIGVAAAITLAIVLIVNGQYTEYVGDVRDVPC